MLLPGRSIPCGDRRFGRAKTDRKVGHLDDDWLLTQVHQTESIDDIPIRARDALKKWVIQPLSACTDY